MPFEGSSYSVLELVQSDALLVEDGNHGENRPLAHEFNATGTPFIRPDDLVHGVVRFEGCDRINDVATRRVRKGKGKAGDILFTHRATVGRMARVGADAPDFVANPGVTVWRVKDSKRICRDFLYYYMQSSGFMDQVWSMAGGTDTFPYISLTQQRTLRLELPSLAEQQAVGSMLASIDDRIELLRQTNAALDAIAHALFKSWFIGYDPVRSKLEGREPKGMSAATAALFPAEFEESALGLIPSGWRISTLAEHVLAERGLSYKGAGLCGAGEGLPMHNLNSVLEGGDYKYVGIKHYSGDYKERHIAVAGDIIVANTEQGHEHRLIGFPAIIPNRYERAIYSHHIYRVRLKPDSPLTNHVLYYTLMTPAVREQVIGCANGSTVNMLKIAGLEIPQFVCPSSTVAKAFEELVGPLRRQMEGNVERSEVLSALRDSLLPRLISGKLRLSDVQTEFEEALT